MGTCTISMAIFNSKLLVYQRVSQIDPWTRWYNGITMKSPTIERTDIREDAGSGKVALHNSNHQRFLRMSDSTFVPRFFPGGGSQRQLLLKNNCHLEWFGIFAIENCHLEWIYPLKMVIFHSYVKLPAGKLVGGDWNTSFMTFHFIYGMSPFPLTNMFQDGRSTTHQISP